MNFFGIQITYKPLIPKYQNKLGLSDQSFLIKFLQLIPKNFTIITNSFGTFNCDILKHSSSVIWNFLQNNTTNFQYHLKINDEENILGKLEQLYQGKMVTIEKTEYQKFLEITHILHIRIIDLKKRYRLKEIPNPVKTKIDYDTMIKILKSDNSIFTIRTNKKDYQCKNICINLSSVIDEFVRLNPGQNTFFYDFLDEYGEFQDICKFFNFENVTLTPKNMNSIKKIAEELKINIILNEIDNYIDDYNKYSEIISQQQDSIDQIDELFDNFHWSISHVINSSHSNNIKATKYITNEILKEKPNEDFLIPFLNAVSINSIELIHFFIDQKVKISFEAISNHIDRLLNTNEETFSIIIENIPPKILYKAYDQIFIRAINAHNKFIVESILKKISNINYSLFLAIKASDLEIVKIILKYNNKPNFVNKRMPKGTALCLAVQKNSLEIVIELLCVPGIDVNLYDSSKNTPLIIAANNYNLDIFNAILDTHGDDKEDGLFNYAFSISSGKITEILINSKYLDINDQIYTENNLPFVNLDESDILNEYNSQKFKETLLMNAVNNQREEIVDIIIQHPNFDRKKSKLNKAIFECAKKCNNINLFKKLIKLIDLNDFNKYKIDGKSFLNYITDFDLLRIFLSTILQQIAI
ncbi:hypothetical protein M9Y10_027603 [Tritrichomonas musculus]|uniref:Ankyrin repeat protein n=1 Tax=Tritrichomonas musculus TaxID=1915356 RepID=A0ABR2H4G1_9EUKA